MSCTRPSRMSTARLKKECFREILRSDTLGPCCREWIKRGGKTEDTIPSSWTAKRQIVRRFRAKR